MPNEEELVQKGEDELSKFMDDPAKVQQAREKADGVLGKYMDQSQADAVTGEAESLLGNFVKEREGGSQS
jgi:hypothetical protein